MAGDATHWKQGAPALGTPQSRGGGIGASPGAVGRLGLSTALGHRVVGMGWSVTPSIGVAQGSGSALSCVLESPQLGPHAWTPTCSPGIYCFINHCAGAGVGAVKPQPGATRSCPGAKSSWGDAKNTPTLSTWQQFLPIPLLWVCPCDPQCPCPCTTGQMDGVSAMGTGTLCQAQL